MQTNSTCFKLFCGLNSGRINKYNEGKYNGTIAKSF